METNFMKKLIIIFGLLSFLFSCEKKIDINNETGVIQKIVNEDPASLPEELEDCDDKINKAKEEPVKIDLSNNADEGCTIE